MTSINWQPIESAPKNGTEIQLACYDRKGIFTGQVVGYYNQGKWIAPKDSDGWQSYYDISEVIDEPKLWHPLIEPPDTI